MNTVYDRPVPYAVYDMSAPAIDFLAVLHAAAPWAVHRTLDECRAMLANSTAYVVAYADGLPVGCGRVISDGVARAYIEDVAVSTKRQGVGRGIVTRLEAEVSNKWCHSERIELVTKEPEFWHALGYVQKSTCHMVKVMR